MARRRRGFFVSARFVVVFEADADRRTATELADRVLRESATWLLEDDSLLDFHREWFDETDDGPLKWKSIKNYASELGLSIRGHFDGEPGLPDAKAARRAIRYILAKLDRVDAIVLIRDLDDQTERREGMEQARSSLAEPIAVILGLANVERESWVVCGFEPKNTDEKQRLEVERRNLGFDPCSHSERLTACKDDQAKKSPKRVLGFLTEDDLERQSECWSETSLSTLKKLGQANGLSDYLAEVETNLVPHVRGRDE